jgi:heterodisulfide reductase subunit A
MTDAVLIVGGGIAGLTAAQQVSAAGAKAIVVERQPVVGGKLAAPMTRAKAIGGRAGGEEIPLFDSLAEDDNICIVTNAALTALEGRAGNFVATVTERARFVTDDCTRCKKCHAVCPVVLPNEFDQGLTFRKAIYTPMITTLPEAWAIDIESCLNKPPNYLPCNRCVEICEDDAIRFDQALETAREFHVGAVILAPGMEIESGDRYTDLGYGVHPDVVTSAELQRLLESPGPSGGFATRPSNEEYPERVLLVLDDPSAFGLYIVASQAKQLLEQDVGDVAVLVLSPPTGTEAATALEQVAGIEVGWGAALQVSGNDDDGIDVSFESLTDNKLIKASYEMLILCVDVLPSAGIDELADSAGVPLADSGYLQTSEGDGAGVESGRPGIFVAGCGSGPKNIRDSIAAAKSAAAGALSQLNPILFEGESAAAESAVPSPREDDDMRAQLEKLLYALVTRER